MIDIKALQQSLSARVDGVAGRETFGLLLAKAAASGVTPTIEKMAQALAKYYSVYGLFQTRGRLVDFVAQICHETGGFKRFEENLNYTAKGLATTWPKRYAVNPKARIKVPNALALALAHRPEAIANDTYGLRMGNISGASDNDQHPDGWQYRGRGPGMMTGKSNYLRYGNAVGLDLIHFPDLASDPGVGVLLFLEYCKQNNVFQAADMGNNQLARMRVNGGVIGLDKVNAIRDRLKGIKT